MGIYVPNYSYKAGLGNYIDLYGLHAIGTIGIGAGDYRSANHTRETIGDHKHTYVTSAGTYLVRDVVSLRGISPHGQF